jgi:dTDP-4-dehydrorhamnose reductase
MSPRPGARSNAHPDIWGGVECTVARIGERFRNQVVETGHQYRLDDLDRIAALGIRTLRYPIVWETIAPDNPEVGDWRWHDIRLRRLDDLGIRVIGGLLHHGSGPRYTNLLDPALPSLLAAHASRVAQRYPWIELFTPVNEPLTTARFSALYGHWYPHARDTSTFLRALVNQCRAVVLAMREIRRVTPAAQLIQTEDIGKTFSAPPLQYQVDLENGRRWLSLDLLCGRVNRDHPLYTYLLGHGIKQADLEVFCDQPCTPDIVGVNHYPTSERYLDPRVEAYPAEFAGGNERDRYADVEAVRMPLPKRQVGPEARLREVWDRYQLPIAVTEVHHGSTREEQVRWLMEVWNAATRLRRTGADVRAVTSWSLFGAVDWNSLLTLDGGFYEPGAFDIRNGTPRPTLIGRAVQSLAQSGEFDHPVLEQPGWWRRPERLYRLTARTKRSTQRRCRRLLLIVGDDDGLTGVIEAAARVRGLDSVLVGGSELDIADPGVLASKLWERMPWAIIDAHANRGSQQSEDPSTSEPVAAACAQLKLPLAVLSGDWSSQHHYYSGPTRIGAALVADGCNEFERRIMQLHNRALIVRAAPHSIDAMFDLLVDGERGVWEAATRKRKHQTRSSTEPAEASAS